MTEAREIIERYLDKLEVRASDFHASAILAALSSAGLHVVPVKPTEAMMMAAMGAIPLETEGGVEGYSYYPARIYRAMLTAAPGGAK